MIMKTAYRVLAYLLALSVAVQASLICVLVSRRNLTRHLVRSAGETLAPRPYRNHVEAARALGNGLT